MNFKIGEKIICINDSPAYQEELIGIIGDLVLNEIYTIREFIYTKDGIGLALEEIVNPIIRFLDRLSEPAYDPARFRKLDYQFAEDLLSQIKEEVQSELIYK